MSADFDEMNVYHGGSRICSLLYILALVVGVL